MVPIAGIGDLAVAVDLSLRVLQILRSIQSAPREISDLVHNVEMLGTVLQSMRSVLEDHGEIPPQRADVMRGLQLVLCRLEEILMGLRTISEEYSQVLCRTPVPPDEDSRLWLWQRTLHNGFLRLRWQTTSDLTADLCNRINQHFTVLNAASNALQMFAPPSAPPW